MKKNLLTAILLVLFSGNLFSQNVLNPGFESWTTGHPNNWYDNGFNPYYTVVQSTDAHSGTYAAKGQVVPVGSFTLPPTLSSSPNGSYGFTMTQAFTTLDFWYKFISDSSDVLDVTAVVYDISHFIIGTGNFQFGAAGSYAHGTVTVTYTGSNPASCNVFFTINNTISSHTHAGSYFILDDVAMTNPSGIQTPVGSTEFLSAFPNPASNVVTINYSLKNSSEVNIGLFDVTGRELIHSSFHHGTGMYQQPIDLSDISAGIYLCKMQTDNLTETRLIEVVK